MGNFFAYLIYKMAQKNYFRGFPVSRCTVMLLFWLNKLNFLFKKKSFLAKARCIFFIARTCFIDLQIYLTFYLPQFAMIRITTDIIIY